MMFVANPGDNGINYNKLSLIYDDGIAPINSIYGSFRYFTILPVNNAPQIWVNSPENGTSIPVSYDNFDQIILDPLDFKGDIHIDGTLNLGSVVNSPYNFGLVFKDIDAFDAVGLDFQIQVVSKPTGSNVVGSLSGFPKNVSGATVKTDYIHFMGSIAQANTYVATLTFNGNTQGNYEIQVTVDDNGFTGRYCPPGANFSLGQRSCPRTSVATFLITAYVSSSVIAGVATGVGGGVLLVAAIGSLLGAKFLKKETTDAWTEWDVENFGDVALTNPLFKGETVTGTSQIYQK